MTTRHYDLSENVVPHQGGEAIADTPAPESAESTTDGKRHDEEITDPTSLDSNPASEDETRNPDDREDVTNLASRRAQAKRAPKLSKTEFSDVCRVIDRMAAANPNVDFGKVVMHGVREYSYRANKNTLQVLAALVPILISAGNFDNADRDSLIKLNNDIIAQQKKEGISGVDSLPQSGGGGAQDPAAMSGVPAAGGGGGPADPTTTNPMSPAPAPTGGAAGAPQDPTQVNLAKKGNSPTPGGPAETNDVDPNAAGGGTAANPLSATPDIAAPVTPATPVTRGAHVIKRGRTVTANGVLHFDTGGPEGPVPVTHLQDHGDGTSLIHNEVGQPEAVNNEDLYHDPHLQMPVTQEHPKDALPETSPEKAKQDAPPTGAPAGGGGQPPAPPKPPAPPQDSSPQTPPHSSPPQDDDKEKKQNPYNSKRASGDTNADGSDPEDVREENKDNTVNPNDSWTRDPGEDLSDSKTSAFSRRRRADAPKDNMGAAKKDTDTQDPEKPVSDVNTDRGESSQYERGEYDQNGPLLTDPDNSTDHNWPPKASAVDAIRLADMYVDFGLISPEQKYQVVAGFEKMNKFIVQDRLKVLTAVAQTKKPERNRALVPQASTNGHRTNGNMPSMQRGSSLKEATRGDVGDHFLAL